VPDTDKVMQLVDKLDKLPDNEVHKLLVAEAGLSDEQAEQCLRLAAIATPDTGFVEQVRALGVTDALLDEGLGELAAVVEGCAPLTGDRVQVVADLKIARGLDYYTGTVFETRLSGFESLGSICSGGRYDALATDGRTTYPGVGISLGVSRVLVPLLAKGVVTADRSVSSAVLVALPAEEARGACEVVAQQLRANGVPTEVAPSPQKFGKQIRYAERRGIPFVWFPPSGATEGSGHEVKDIRSGAQSPADPATWTPPTQDLRPRVLVSGGQSDFEPAAQSNESETK
jgi:histidyl-tRNA synthetase